MDGLATFVINLDRATQRMEETARQLNDAGLPFTRLPAVDGADLPPETGAQAMTHLGREMMAGELGCYQSHLNAAEAFLASDAELGLVLEDDVALTSKSVPMLQAMITAKDRFAIWDVMNLARPAKRWRSAVRPAVWGGPGQLCHAHQFPLTTTAILWSRGGAQMFLTQHRSMRFPVDVQLQDWVAETGRGLAFEGPPFTAREEASTIGAEKRSRQAQLASNYQSLRLKRLWRTHLSAIRQQTQSKYPT